MSKVFALTLAFLFLASCVFVAKPVSGEVEDLEPTATVTVLASTGGTTDPPAGTSTYYVEYIFSTTVSLTAHPDNGFVFLYWAITSAEGNAILYGNSTTITVGDGGYGFECTVQAVFQPIPPPKISLLSPLNQIYNESSVPLVFTVDKSVNWMSYSLDGNQNVTITGNGTIANMKNGLHSIMVYANDTFGDVGVSENATFTIALAPIANPEHFPTATVAVVSGTLAVVVVAGLLAYFKKCKPATHRIIEGHIT